MTIIPMRDLKDTVEIERRCAAAGGPVFVTKNGYGRLVVMDIEYYEKTADIKNLSVEISDQNVYDIFGRRVNNLQPGQFYIKSDGRLFFNR